MVGPFSVMEYTRMGAGSWVNYNLIFGLSPGDLKKLKRRYSVGPNKNGLDIQVVI